MFPPPPVNTIDWGNIGFLFREVNGHIESRYNRKDDRWTEPEFVQDPYLRLHGMAPGINYGQQCFEGLKAFRSPDDNSINVFRPKENAIRMARSAEFVSIPPVPVDHFLKCINMAVAQNAEYVPPHASGAAMYIRPMVIGSQAHLGLTAPDEYLFTVYVLPTGVFHGVHPVEALIMEEFDRSAPEGTGSAKLGGNYGPVLRWSDKAKKRGFGITLHLDSKTRSEIDEFSTSGFIGIKKQGEQITMVIPDSNNVIKSVTSESVQDLARSFGWKVEKRRVPYEELSTFDEVMAAGTAAALVPIKSITMDSKGDKFEYVKADSDEPGPICKKLLETLQGVQRGTIKDTFGWKYQVEEVHVNGEAGKTNGTHGNGFDGHVDKLP